jgi:hypothetical protein
VGEDAIILHFDATGPNDPLRAPGTDPEDAGRPVGWDDRNAMSVATWPLPGPDSVDTRTKAPAASHLYWPGTLQLAYPKGSLVPVEMLPKLIDAEEYEALLHPEPEPKKKRRR